MRGYVLVSGGIFAVVALVHAVRLLEGSAVQVGPFAAPMWVSWLAVIVTGALATWAFALGARR